MDKLKPCPFCGEMDELAVLFYPHELTYFVSCEACESRGSKIRTKLPFGNCLPEDGERIAIERWNERK